MIEKLTQNAVDAISNNPRLRNQFQSGNENTRRIILQAWYSGYTLASDATNLPSEQEFLNHATPDVVKAVAA